MRKRFVNVTGTKKEIPKVYRNLQNLLCMSHILFKSNFLFSGCTVKFHMASDELLDDRYCFPGQKCAEDSADSDSVESMEDCKGEDYGGCQTAEIKGCLDDFIILFYNLG